MSRYTFHIIADRIKGWMGKRHPWYEIRKPGGMTVFGSSDRDAAGNMYTLLCQAFNEGERNAVPAVANLREMLKELHDNQVAGMKAMGQELAAPGTPQRALYDRVVAELSVEEGKDGA